MTGNHLPHRGQVDGHDIGGGRAAQLPFPLPDRRPLHRPFLRHDLLHQDGPQPAEGNKYNRFDRPVANLINILRA